MPGWGSGRPLVSYLHLAGVKEGASIPPPADFRDLGPSRLLLWEGDPLRRGEQKRARAQEHLESNHICGRRGALWDRLMGKGGPAEHPSGPAWERPPPVEGRWRRGPAGVALARQAPQASATASPCPLQAPELPSQQSGPSQECERDHITGTDPVRLAPWSEVPALPLVSGALRKEQLGARRGGGEHPFRWLLTPPPRRAASSAPFPTSPAAQWGRRPWALLPPVAALLLSLPGGSLSPPCSPAALQSLLPS